jgi:hypothetical protein
MKKILFTLLVVCFAGATAFAQLSGGLKAGLNLANFGGDVENTDMRASFHFGGYVTFSLADKITLQPELLYNSVGAKYDFVESDDFFGDIKWEGAFKLNYLSLPVMFGYNISDNFSIQAGPQLGFILSAKDEGEASVDGFTESYDDDIKDGLKGTDFGFNFGIGLNFGKLNASARYSLGLSNVNDGTGDIKNNVIQLSIGYTLFGN